MKLPTHTKLPRRALALTLTILFALNYASPVIGCGPWFTEPIFVFKESPDLPFEQFTSGNLGIVRPSFGRKTLVIAYRYLNGGSFTGEEQRELVYALKGTAPEPDSPDPIKAWINARKELFGDEQQLPQLYTEREHGGYDFFPNCTANAFEVATQTMRDRVATYGAGDANVKLWLQAQDIVFENCASGSHIPAAAGDGSPEWLRKDRDYQIAAAHFYSLNFDEARLRFEQIAVDAESPWKDVAAYLSGRTLVRQASLAMDETKQREFYAQAESVLELLVSAGGKFANASQKLLGLVKYHLRPEQRVVELGQNLAIGNDDNLRQDLIDYVWLLDKLELRVLKAEEEQKKKLAPPAEETKPAESAVSASWRHRAEQLGRGELINVALSLPPEKGSGRYPLSLSLDFHNDASEAEIMRAFEEKIGRPFTPDEITLVKKAHADALATRQWYLSPNRKWEEGRISQYEGCTYDCGKLTPDLVPDFFRADDLSDWIVTFHMRDGAAYTHALSRWRETRSNAWLVAALSKAAKSSKRVAELMRSAEKIPHDDPSYLTLAYDLVRLKAETGRQAEARKLLDEILTAPAESLPVSTLNLFTQQRMSLAKDLNDFLASSERKPVTFYNEYGLGTLAELREREKHTWDPHYSNGTKEKFAIQIDNSYKPLLLWQDRSAFDSQTTDIFNWQFPLQLLSDAARNRDFPDYLQRNLMLAAWTRAVLLNNDAAAQRIAPDVLRLAPEMTSVFTPYLNARTAKQRHRAALYVLLKFPNLSPYVVEGLPRFSTTEELDYMLETAWWCPQTDIDYDEDANEVPKVVEKPGFLTAEQLETALRERVALRALGDGKSYLGKQVLEWAKAAPLDPRVPEALFIAIQANERYKYGCDGWNYDEETRDAAEKILSQRYAQSPWSAKLHELRGE